MKHLDRLLKVLSLVVFMLILSSMTALAQTTIKGNVSDESGEPLIGAAITVVGNKSAAAVTDLDGNFQLKAPSNHVTLSVSYIGMKTQKVTVNGSAPLRIVMQADAQTTEEVVVVGYGQQKKASVVGAITQADSKVLQRSGGVSSLGAALTGNLPGVITSQSSGMPGEEDPQIVIRGVSTWADASPLILVDGIERPMNSVDINSVANISVLKDASATAVYGVRGANGVILITTKRGSEGKAKIEIGMQMSAKVVSKLPTKFDSYNSLRVRNQAAENELGLEPASWSKVLPDYILDKYRNPANLEEAERYPNVDWANELFNKSAMAYNPNINVSGGTKYVKYYASLDFLHEGDLYKVWDNNRGYESGFGYNRINVRSNLDFQLTKTTQLRVDLSGSHGVSKSPYGVARGSWAETQLWEAAYSAPSNAFLPRYSDGTWGYYPDDTQGAHNSVQDLATAGIGETTNTRINTNFTLTQNLDFILKGLQASATVSWDNTFQEVERGIDDRNHGTQTKWINPETGEETYAQKGDNKTGFDFNEGILWATKGGSVQVQARNLYYEGKLFWAGKFGLHEVTAMTVLNRAETAWGNEFAHYRQDFAFRATYNYANRYNAEINGAYNGSEQFGRDYRMEFFPSFGIGWTVSEEKFFKPVKKYMDYLKLRFSWGEVGNDRLGNERWLYATQWAYNGKSYMDLTAGTSPYTWYKVSKIGNPNVHWETAIKRNYGIDYSFLGGLLAGSFEIFSENRKDLLVFGKDRAVPTYFGFAPAAANLGRTETHGYEFTLRVNKTFGDVRLWGNFNMSHARNKIIVKDDPLLMPSYQKQAGYAIGQGHSYLTTGFANTWDEVYGMTPHDKMDNQKMPGSYTVIDYNADGVIDSNDSAPYGYTSTPENTYSGTIGASYKGFDLSIQLYGVTNVNRYVAFNSLGKKLDTVFDEGTLWTKYTQDADAPMPRINTTPEYAAGTRFNYDGSFIRLKNVELSYTFTQQWIKSVGLSSVKLYLSGNNLWVWSRMPDDRESNFAGTGLGSQGAYPTVKRFTMGLKINL